MWQDGRDTVGNQGTHSAGHGAQHRAYCGTKEPMSWQGDPRVPGTKGTVEPGDGSRGSRVPLIGHYVYKTKDVPFWRTVFSRHYYYLEISSLATLA